MPKQTQSPGEMLKAMIEKNKFTLKEFAEKVNLPQGSVSSVVRGKSRLSVPMAFRLARFFNTVPEYWLAAQIKHEIAEAGKDKALVKSLNGIKPLAKKPWK